MERFVGYAPRPGALPERVLPNGLHVLGGKRESVGQLSFAAGNESELVQSCRAQREL